MLSSTTNNNTKQFISYGVWKLTAIGPIEEVKVRENSLKNENRVERQLYNSSILINPINIFIILLLKLKNKFSSYIAK